jgi:hypothetical protein
LFFVCADSAFFLPRTALVASGALAPRGAAAESETDLERLEGRLGFLFGGRD